jgi:hypothetical protein
MQEDSQPSTSDNGAGSPNSAEELMVQARPSQDARANDVGRMFRNFVGQVRSKRHAILRSVLKGVLHAAALQDMLWEVHNVGSAGNSASLRIAETQ